MEHNSKPFRLPFDMAYFMFSFLTQSELLSADTCCRTWRMIISAPTFWVSRKLYASRQFFSVYCPSALRLPSSTIEVLCEVLVQPRFSSIRALNLFFHNIKVLYKAIQLLRDLSNHIMPDLQEVDLCPSFHLFRENNPSTTVSSPSISATWDLTDCLHDAR